MCVCVCVCVCNDGTSCCGQERVSTLPYIETPCRKETRMSSNVDALYIPTSGIVVSKKNGTLLDFATKTRAT